MPRPIRVAVVGGHCGGTYGQAFDVLSYQIILAAICDVSPAVLADWSKVRPAVQNFVRYEDLLDANACDVVFLATPMELHAKQAIQAL
jgi:predicted dehydrogenase